MSFLHPEFLYYMLIPLFILFGLLLTQKESQVHFFSEEVLNKLRVSGNTLSLKIRNLLFMLMGFFMIVALAQPVIDDGLVEVKAKSADIMIALDISDSMLAEDVYPNRIELAKQKAIDLLGLEANERIGIIGFAKNSYLVSPLSFDHGAVSFLLSQLSTKSITEKGTDFLTMLDVVDKSLDKKAKRYLLIVSDGGDKDDFSAEIASAKKKNITVFVLGIGTLKGAPIKLEDGSFITQNSKIIISKLNENIAKFATQTGGVYIQNSKSDDDVKAMLEEIQKIGVEKELKSESVKRFIPLFYYPIAIALLLLLIATSSLRKITKVIPIFILFLTYPHAEAGMLDFVDLSHAKEAYEKGDYQEAASLYEKHAEGTGNAQSYYNAGNSFYQHKKYKEAVNLYEKAIFDKPEYKAKTFANLGNAHAKLGTQDDLEKAKKRYEQSLELIDDSDVKSDLEKVKKLIEKKKEQNASDGGDKDGKKKDKDSKEKKDSKEDKEKDSKEQSKEDKEQNSKDEKKSKEDKDKDSKDGDKSKKDEENKSDEQKDKEIKQENNETKQQKKQDLEQLGKDENQTKNSPTNALEQKDSVEKMSDAEEKKWLEQLNLQQNSYMYMLNEEKEKKENTDEKPW